jgi:hypothetical protein
MELKLNVPVEFNRPKLIPHLSGDYPAYFIYGPIVFTVATEDFISAITGGAIGATSPNGQPSINGASVYNALSLLGSPLVTRRSDKSTADEQQLVLIPAPLFPHKLTKGYSNPAGRVVKSVNGIGIKSLRHLVEVLRDAKDEFIVIEMTGRNIDPLVFPRKEMVAATEGILADNGIRSLGSPDVLDVWNLK